jgi:hypothetical protein
MSTQPLTGRRYRWLARLGFATKGIVYVLMGSLATLAALGQRGGQIGDKRRTVQTLQGLPGGRALLILVAVGLSGYALLRVLQGLLDTEARGRGPKGLVRRFGYVMNGLIYTGLIGYTAHAVLHRDAGESARESEQSWAMRALAWPGGALVLTLVGAVIISACVFTLYQAASGKFLEQIDVEALGVRRRAFALRAGQIGYGARAVVMGIVGGFFLHAGHTARASDVGSTEDALDLLRRMGPGVLGVVAAGLMAYGLYALMQSRYPVRPKG